MWKGIHHVSPYMRFVQLPLVESPQTRLRFGKGLYFCTPIRRFRRVLVSIGLAGRTGGIQWSEWLREPSAVRDVSTRVGWRTGRTRALNLRVTLMFRS